MRTFITILALCCQIVAIAQTNEKPFVIPEVTTWKGAVGTTPLSGKIVVEDFKFMPVAEQLASEMQLLHNRKFTIVKSQAGQGDIVFANTPRLMDENENYALIISDRITISAPTPKAALWATNTLLQMSESPENKGQKQISLPRGTIVDEPQYPMRGFMIDAGRKYIPMDYLYNLVKIMSYYKMNTLQIHLNDNGMSKLFDNDWDKTYAAFRLECDTYPSLTAKDGSYTKQEFIALQKFAESYGVEIIPEIDAPAHSLAFTHYRPSLGSKEYGMDHLDLSNPDVYPFMDALWKEYIGGENPVFIGPRVNIGTDEYSNAKQEVVEQFRKFTDHYLELIQSYGKQPALWGALTHAKGETPVRHEGVLMNCWYNGYAAPDSMKQIGYQILSIPDGLVYIVPAAGYYYDYLNCENLYNNWTPAHVRNVRFEEQDPQLEGGMFAVWNDHVGNGISVKDIHHRVMPALQTMATKCWTGVKTTLPYSDFDKARLNLSEAPGVNELATVPETPVVLKKVKSNTLLKLPISEAGYDSSVEFTVDCKAETKGTILFEGPNAIFYASTPDSARLGFSRDDYMYNFNYTLPSEGKVTLRIEMTNKETRLFVDNKHVETLAIEKRNGMSWVQTLVFPLHRTGCFNSRISNLCVTKINK